MKTWSSTCLSAALVALASIIGLSTAAQTFRLVSEIDPTQGPAAGGSGDSWGPVLSADGRYVLFASTANNLLLTTNNTALAARFPAVLNAFLRDRTNGTTTLVSPNFSGTGGGDGDSIPIAISTNGRYVLLESRASNLVAGDTNNTADIFLRDLASGTTLLVSIDPSGLPGDYESHGATMTPDARYIAFASTADNLVAGDTNQIGDVFVRDMLAGVTALASVGAVSTNRITPQGSSETPVITPNGRYVAFFSTATNLVAGVPPGGDVYVRDLMAGTTLWASAGARTNLQAVLHYIDPVSYNHAISDDGQFVAYETSSAGHPASAGLILRYDTTLGVTQLAHTNAESGYGTYQDVSSLDMTPDGRFVAFIAYTNGTTTTCIQLWDATTGIATLVSGDISSNQVPATSTCDAPVIEPSGRFIAFVSSANILNSSNYPGGYHVYLRDMAGTTTLVDAGSNGVGSSVSPSTIASLSEDGRLLAFEANDGSLVSDDRNRDSDVFLRDMQTGALELISARHPALPSFTPNGVSMMAATSISGDGRYVAFGSEADNLVANDTNGCRDIFVRDLVVGTNRLVSVATNGAVGDLTSSEPGISPDGRYVTFTSIADNLVSGDTNGAQDVFIRDLQAGTTSLVSINTNGTGPGNGPSYSAAVSDGGRFVVFRSTASNLAPGASPLRYENLFVRDLQSGVTYGLTTVGVLASAMTPDARRVAWVESSGSSSYKIYVWDSLAAARIYTNTATAMLAGVGISRDGNQVAYWSGSTTYALFISDLAAQTTSMIVTGVPAFARPVLRFSANGQALAYSCTNQVCFYDSLAGSSLLVSHADGSLAQGSAASDLPDISADGRFVAYRSAATNLVAGDTNMCPDIFLYDRQTGSNTLLSADQFGGFSANNRSLTPVFSGDGRMLFFQSWASDLSSQDYNHNSDLFAYAFFYAMLVPGSGPGQGVWVSWPFDANRSYRVQFKDSLGDVNWQELGGTVTNSAGRAWLQDPAPNVGKRFYRIVAF